MVISIECDGDVDFRGSTDDEIGNVNSCGVPKKCPPLEIILVRYYTYGN